MQTTKAERRKTQLDDLLLQIQDFSSDKSNQLTTTEEKLGISSHDLEFDANRVIERPKKDVASDRYRASILELDSLMSEIDPSLALGSNLSKRVTRLEMLVQSPGSMPRSMGGGARGISTRSRTVPNMGNIPKQTVTSLSFNVKIIPMLSIDNQQQSKTTVVIVVPISETASFILNSLNKNTSINSPSPYTILKSVDGSRVNAIDPILLLTDPTIPSSAPPTLTAFTQSQYEMNEGVDLDSYDSLEFILQDRVEALTFRDGFWAWSSGVVCDIDESEGKIERYKVQLGHAGSEELWVAKDLLRCITILTPPLNDDGTGMNWTLGIGTRVECCINGGWFAGVVVGSPVDGTVSIRRAATIVPVDGEHVSTAGLGVRSLKWRLRGFKPRVQGDLVECDVSKCKIGWHCQIANKIIG